MALPSILKGLVRSGRVALDAYTTEDDDFKKRRLKEKKKWTGRLDPSVFDLERSDRRKLYEDRMRRSNLSGKHALSTSPRLELQSENGDPVLFVSEIADSGILNWETAKTSGPQISGLSAIFSAISSLSVAGNVFTSNYAKVDIPLGELSNSKVEGTSPGLPGTYWFDGSYPRR